MRATGYVRDAPATLLDAGAGYPVERLRQRVRDAIYANVDDRRAAGVLAALAVGDQGAIERDDWDLFRNTGVAHLMSISGLHITMFAWLAGLAIAFAWRRSSRAMLWLAAPIAARWGGLLAATAYAVFSGWGVPSQRTIWMLATVTVLRAAGVRWPWLLVLLLAAVVVTALDPWALTQAGFWLSFMAVGLLMASSPATTARRRRQQSERRLARLAAPPLASMRDRIAYAGDRDARPDAADAGLLPAGLAGRLLSPTWSRSRSSRWSSRRSRCSALPSRRCGRSAPRSLQAFDACWAASRRSRARSGSCRWRRSGPSSPVCSRPRC